ncbi:MAG: Thiosulfate sulfurtransferase [Gammaproteobacteria bacterium]|nr:Thiosulfate sulfurtransferase [Gammaproteobacteria bacterium]
MGLLGEPGTVEIEARQSIGMGLEIPVIIEASELKPLLDRGDVVIVDLGNPETYAQAHVPGALRMEYSKLVRGDRPAPGHLPEPESFSRTLSEAGITPEHALVAYDDEGGGKACRLIWNLHAAGHAQAGVLDGGIYAWTAENLSVSTESRSPEARDYGTIEYTLDPVATRDEILERLGDPGLVLLDARTPEEYAGTKVRAVKGGHIPGAVNLNWLDCIDRANDTRLFSDDILREMLTDRGVTENKDIVTYCHTHHRSTHTYVMLKHLGFQSVKGYAGSWSEWGNDPETPVES